MDWIKYSAGKIGLMMAEKKLSSVELTKYILDRISETDSEYGAYITVSNQYAIEQAEKADKNIAAGQSSSLLAGVPMAVKDNICTAGIKTTCASRMLSDFIPPYSATAVKRLEKAGSVILGKTNMDEFAMGSTTETSFFKVTRNPWNLNHVPGGSSGGSAVAVASGEAFFALGSDTGGSIRQPCSYCGLTGLKPSYGLVSRYGLIAYASSLDQIGPVASDAADCSLIFSHITGNDKYDSTSIPDNKLDIKSKMSELTEDIRALLKDGNSEKFSLKNIKIAIPKIFLTHQLQPEVKKVFDQTIDSLEKAGAVCEYCELPLLDESIPAYYIIATAEASANLSRYDGIQYGHRTDRKDFSDLKDFYSYNRTEGFGSEVRQRIMLGTFALSSGYYDAYYLKAQKIRKLIQKYYKELLDQYDFILGPVAPTTAPEIGASLKDPLAMYLSDVFTVGANLTGLPALSFPCGYDDKGLPIGLQLTSAPFKDPELLRAVISWQQITDFHTQKPEDRRSAK